MFEIEFYQLSNGLKPAEQFILQLNPKIQVKALDSLDLLKEFGNTLREPYSKPIAKGVFELRIKFSNDIARVFYFFYTGKKIIVTNGFIKKTQKTPKSEIELALKYKADYERRKSDE